MSGLRPSLRRFLVLVVGLSAVAMIWPGSRPALVAALERPPTEDPNAASPVLGASKPDSAPLPERLPAQALGPSSFDPFVGVQTSPPVAQAASSPPPFVGPIYVPPPPPPAVSYRYMGQLTDPSGNRVVYLARPDKEVAVTTGTRLDEGYVVESISTEGIRLFHPPSAAKVLVPVPQGTDVTALAAPSPAR